MPWYFYKKNGSQKIERRDYEQPGVIKMTAAGPTLSAGTEAEAKTAQPEYLYCNGAPVLEAEFLDLYNAFGSDKFRNGKTIIAGSFYLPDYRRNVPVGSGTGFTMASVGGSLTHTHTLPDHLHAMPHSHTVNDHSHEMNHNHTGPSHSHTFAHTHGATGSTGPASNAYVSYADSDYIRITNGGQTEVRADTTSSPADNRFFSHDHDFSIYTTDTGTAAFSRQGHTHPSVTVTTNSQSTSTTGLDGTGNTGNVQNGPNGQNTGDTSPETGPAAPPNTGNPTTSPTITDPSGINSVQPYQVCNFIIKI